jgi:hypothetical protein
MGVSHGTHNERSKKYSEAYAANAAKDVERGCVGLTGSDLAKCATEIVEANRESQRSESDLSAQWQAANWVLWATIIAGAQLLATAIGLVFVKRTLDATLLAVEDTGEATDAMREQNRIAADTAQRQLRAYVSLFNVEVRNLEAGSVATFKGILINAGQTPAYDFAIRTSALLHPAQADSHRHRFTHSKTVRLGVIARDGKPAVHTPEDEPWTQAQINDLKSGQLYLTYAGIYSYRDVFGKRHIGSFMAKYDPGITSADGAIALLACPRGNRSS